MYGPEWSFLLAHGPGVVVVNCWDRFCTLGRAPRTKETLPDFREWCWGYLTSTSISQVDRLSTRHLGIGASQLGIRAKVNNYLGSSVGVFISLVLIPASQLGIRA